MTVFDVWLNESSHDRLPAGLDSSTGAGEWCSRVSGPGVPGGSKVG